MKFKVDPFQTPDYSKHCVKMWIRNMNISTYRTRWLSRGWVLSCLVEL